MIFGNDTIQLPKLVQEGAVNENGDYTGDEVVYDEPILCDAQPARGEKTQIVTPDGKTARYSYVVTLDVDVPEIAYGTAILLTVGIGNPQELSVKGFHRYSFCCKLWV